MRKHYILTGSPKTTIEDIVDLFDDTDSAVMDRSRRLQARRWRKIRNQEL